MHTLLFASKTFYVCIILVKNPPEAKSRVYTYLPYIPSSKPMPVDQLLLWKVSAKQAPSSKIPAHPIGLCRRESFLVAQHSLGIPKTEKLDGPTRKLIATTVCTYKYGGRGHKSRYTLVEGAVQCLKPVIPSNGWKPKSAVKFVILVLFTGCER
jgi:hypothetical protein